MTTEPDTDYLLRRAAEESILAIRSDQTEAGDVHYAMALLYSAKARRALAERCDRMCDRDLARPTSL